MKDNVLNVIIYSNLHVLKTSTAHLYKMLRNEVDEARKIGTFCDGYRYIRLINGTEFMFFDQSNACNGIRGLRIDSYKFEGGEFDHDKRQEIMAVLTTSLK